MDILTGNSIAVDPNDSQTLYVGAGDYDGFGVRNFGLRSICERRRHMDDSWR